MLLFFVPLRYLASVAFCTKLERKVHHLRVVKQFQKHYRKQWKRQTMHKILYIQWKRRTDYAQNFIYKYSRRNMKEVKRNVLLLSVVLHTAAVSLHLTAAGSITSLSTPLLLLLLTDKTKMSIYQHST